MTTATAVSAESWEKALRRALRRWSIPIIGLGVACALLAGWVAASAPARASAIVEVQTDAVDPVVLARQMQSTKTAVESSTAFADAARTVGRAEDEVRRITRLTSAADATHLVIEASAGTVADSARIANAVADAAIAFSTRAVREQVAAVADTTSEAMRTAPLADAQAERARINRLGEGLADNQTKILGGSRSLSVIQRASETAGDGGSSPWSMGVLGLLGGLLLGGLVAAVLPRHRGSVGRINDVRELYPGVETVTMEDLPAIVAAMDPQIRRVVVSDISRARRAGTLRQLADRLSSAGYAVAVHSGAKGIAAAPPPAAEQTLSVVEAPASITVARVFNDDPETMTVYPVYLGQTRAEDLDRIAPYFCERTVLLAMQAVDESSEEASHESVALGIDA